jgi:uncharacterized protein (DUF934 family)
MPEESFPAAAAAAPGLLPQLIRFVDGVAQLAPDDWRVIDAPEIWDGSGGALLPLEFALSHADRVRASGRFGIWLSPTDEPERAVPLFPDCSLIAVEFPKFGDGRGYSTAYLLRTRHGWKGEMRAIGEVLQDQLFMQRRVGFDSFALAPGRDADAALRAFTTYSDVYQASVEPQLPAFRRGVL